MYRVCTIKYFKFVLVIIADLISDCDACGHVWVDVRITCGKVCMSVYICESVSCVYLCVCMYIP